MASNGEDVKRAALAEMARRELAKRRGAQPRAPGVGQQIGRLAGQGARMVAEGAMDVVSPWADLAALGLNSVLPGKPFPERHSEALSQNLTQMGLSEPQGGVEKFSNIAGRMITGAAASGAIDKGVRWAAGLTDQATGGASAAIEAARQKGLSSATAPGAATLQAAGVPLDAGQRSGNPVLNRLRSAFTDNPATLIPQQKFNEGQQRAFTRAVLRTIGSESDEATQTVMLEAKKRIGAVFEDVAKKSPAVFDDALQSSIADRMATASRVLKPDELSILQKQVDFILQGVEQNGTINGTIFKRSLSDLSALTPRQDVGVIAAGLEEDLLGALERSTSPAMRSAMQTARQQWRSMRMMEPAIGHGVEKFISPQRLSNGMGQVRNRAMSVYGQGGDQNLVRLSEAGRSILPESLPQSGTAPRGLLNAPWRAVAMYPVYRPAQALMQRQPQTPLARNLANPQAAGAASAFLAQILAQQQQQQQR